MIFDTHAHYDDDAFAPDRDELLGSLPTHGIGAVMNIGASIRSSADTLKLIERYPFVYGAVGVHPSETEGLTEGSMEWLKQAAGHERVMAIGEIGLDYYWDEPDRKIQKTWFERQMALAKEVGLPVVIHSRDAAQDTLDMVKSGPARETGGVIHCFSYGVEIAKEYLDMGFFLGIGGVLTFQNAKKLKEVVAYTPIDKLVLETDCPYLAPVPFRGKRNSSLNLPYVVDAVSEIKDIPAAQVIKITWENAMRLYRIPEGEQRWPV